MTLLGRAAAYVRGHGSELRPPRPGHRPVTAPDPHVLVLFGANGDLAERMIYPALYRLAAAGRTAGGVRRGRHRPSRPRGDLGDAVRDAVTGAVDGARTECSTTSSTGSASRPPTPTTAAALAQAVGRRAARRRRGRRRRRRRAPARLPLGPAGVDDRHRRDARARGPHRPRPAASWRSRSGTTWSPRASSTPRSRPSPTRATSSASTTSSARRRCRTCSPCASPTACSARPGTPATVESVQIDVPETLGLEGRGSFYETTGCLRDMVSTHLSQILGFVAIDPPRDLHARRAARRQGGGVRGAAPVRQGARRLRPVRGLPRRRRHRRRLGGRDLRRARRRTSTTSAGTTCRSTCAPARRWPTTGAR